MADKPTKITTEADLLMNLLKEVNEISLDEAAKVLGIPSATLENWANFLEEEHLLSVKYKFTTPYLVYSEPGSSQKHVQEKFERPMPKEEEEEDYNKSVLKRTEELVQKVDTELRRGDFSNVKASLPELLAKTKSYQGTVQLPAGQKEATAKQLGELDSLLQKANYAAETGRYDEASRLYSRIHRDLKELIFSLKQVYSDVERQKQRKEEASADIKVLLDRAYASIGQGNVKDASRLYAQLRELHQRMPSDFARRKLEVERDLLKLNKDLSNVIDRKSLEEMREGTKKIVALIRVCEDANKKGQIARAEEAYYEMKKLFEQLPSGFYRERKALEQKILILFGNLSRIRKELLSREYLAKSSKVHSLLAAIQEDVKAGRVKEAIDKYHEAKATYDSIPKAFVREKLIIFDRLMPAHHSLSQAYAEAAGRELKEKSAQIVQLIRRMQDESAQGKIEDAGSTYEGLKRLHASLPEGFIAEKIDLQNAIIRSYEAVLSKAGSYMAADIHSKLVALDRKVAEAGRYLRAGRLELAEEMYSEAASDYARLPQGFDYQKSIARKKVLELYRELMLRTDHKILASTTSEVNGMYHEILKLLIEAKHHMEARQFGLLEPDYHKVRKVFNELPLGFVQEKLRLWESVAELAREVDFYRKVSIWEKAAAEKAPGLAEMHRDIASLGEKLSMSEARQLMEHWEQRNARAQASAQPRQSVATSVQPKPAIAAKPAIVKPTPIIAATASQLPKAPAAAGMARPPVSPVTAFRQTPAATPRPIQPITIRAVSPAANAAAQAIRPMTIRAVSPAANAAAQAIRPMTRPAAGMPKPAPANTARPITATVQGIPRPGIFHAQNIQGKNAVLNSGEQGMRELEIKIRQLRRSAAPRIRMPV
ncbi:hypothetical protein HYY74_06075 [Candidatus Woesearchaeota archaeon]|nr:hypothetical protein [Candidatus Woesearchaeota archaeon]